MNRTIIHIIGELGKLAETLAKEDSGRNVKVMAESINALLDEVNHETTPEGLQHALLGIAENFGEGFEVEDTPEGREEKAELEYCQERIVSVINKIAVLEAQPAQNALQEDEEDEEKEADKESKSDGDKDKEDEDKEKDKENEDKENDKEGDKKDDKDGSDSDKEDDADKGKDKDEKDESDKNDVKDKDESDKSDDKEKTDESVSEEQKWNISLERSGGGESVHFGYDYLDEAINSVGASAGEDGLLHIEYSPFGPISEMNEQAIAVGAADSNVKIILTKEACGVASASPRNIVTLMETINALALNNVSAVINLVESDVIEVKAGSSSKFINVDPVIAPKVYDESQAKTTDALYNEANIKEDKGLNESDVSHVFVVKSRGRQNAVKLPEMPFELMESEIRTGIKAAGVSGGSLEICTIEGPDEMASRLIIDENAIRMGTSNTPNFNHLCHEIHGLLREWTEGSFDTANVACGIDGSRVVDVLHVKENILAAENGNEMGESKWVKHWEFPLKAISESSGSNESEDSLNEGESDAGSLNEGGTEDFPVYQSGLPIMEGDIVSLPRHPNEMLGRVTDVIAKSPDQGMYKSNERWEIHVKGNSLTSEGTAGDKKGKETESYVYQPDEIIPWANQVRIVEAGLPYYGNDANNPGADIRVGDKVAYTEFPMRPFGVVESINDRGIIDGDEYDRWEIWVRPEGYGARLVESDQSFEGYMPGEPIWFQPQHVIFLERAEGSQDGTGADSEATNEGAANAPVEESGENQEFDVDANLVELANKVEGVLESWNQYASQSGGGNVGGITAITANEGARAMIEACSLIRSSVSQANKGK